MPAFGRFGFFPVRFGGAPSRVKAILESINAQMGDGYNTSPTSLVYARNLALAKCIDNAWSLNVRLANQGNPDTITTLLSRWEKMLALPMEAGLSDPERRARIAEVNDRFGAEANYQYVYDRLSEKLGPVFGGLEFISFANAVIAVPDGTYPWGQVYPGTTWSSTVAHILIYTIKPASYNEGQYYEAVGRVNQVLEPLLPAWVTWDWYREPVSSPINVSGGPSHGGFYLDDEHNTDNNVFDV